MHAYLLPPSMPSNPHLTPRTPLPLHEPLPRLRPHHEPHTLKRRIEDPLIELAWHFDALERIAAPVNAAGARTDVVFPDMHNVLAALVTAAFATHGAHGVGILGVAEVATIAVFVDVGTAIVSWVVPGGDIRGDGRRDARRTGTFSGRNEGGSGAEDFVELGVNVGFDIDGIRRCAGVDEADEDAQTDAEHGCSGSTELGCGFAGFVKGFLALLGEGDDFSQKDDIFAIEFHAGGVDLETIVIAA